MPELYKTKKSLKKEKKEERSLEQRQPDAEGQKEGGALLVKKRLKEAKQRAPSRPQVNSQPGVTRKRGNHRRQSRFPTGTHYVMTRGDPS